MTLREQLMLAFAGPIAELNSYWCNGHRWCGGEADDPHLPVHINEATWANGCQPSYCGNPTRCACRDTAAIMADKAIAITSSPQPTADPRPPRGDADDDGA
jgi:hypothetical protein